MAVASCFRLKNTWDIHKEKTRKLILANVKANLHTVMGGFDRQAEVESSNPCALVVTGTYEDKLQRELEQTMANQKPPQLVQRCTSPAEEGTMLERREVYVGELDSQFAKSYMGSAGKQLREDLQDDERHMSEREVDEEEGFSTFKEISPEL